MATLFPRFSNILDGNHRSCSAELLDLLVIRAGALLFNEADPVRETAFRRPFKPRLTMVHSRGCSLNVLFGKLGAVCFDHHRPNSRTKAALIRPMPASR